MEPLKNLYSEDLIIRLAKYINEYLPSFDEQGFIKSVFDDHWKDLELKQRTRHVTNCLHHSMLLTYPRSIEVLKKVAPHFNGFTAIVFPDYVEVFGLEHYELSIEALELFTQYSTGEFAVRPFIKKYNSKTMAHMMLWAKHTNPHVRRLASEGCRPRLPWALALPEFKKDPTPILPILELLKSDSSEYVRRSVANNLNDISKDHPDLVLQIASRWKDTSPETNWIIRHACRGLLKKAHPDALEHFGFYKSHTLQIENFYITSNSLKIGESFNFSFSVHLNTSESQKLRIEYVIYFMKAKGSLSRKVFKISENHYPSSKEIVFNKKHSFKDLTTRKHYPGKHKIAIVINGKELQALEFDLLR